MNFTKQLLIVMALLLATPAAMAQRYVTDSCLVNGLMRRYRVYLPAGIKPGAPLVVCMHGYGSWAKPSRYDLDPVADREGFAVCYPCGVRDTTGKWGWNVKYPTQAALHNNEVDDVVAITQHVQRQFNLSTVNTFATGMSNGGDMCYALAYSGTMVFSAYGSVAGQTQKWLYDGPTAPRPVPFLEIHGTADKVSVWDGDVTGKTGWNPYISVPMGVGYWVARDRCSSVVTDTIPSKRGSKGHITIRHKYSGGLNGTQVWWYKVIGAPHSWHAKDLNTGEDVWGFFKQFLK